MTAALLPRLPFLLGDPSPSLPAGPGVPHLVAAAANYSGHPTIPDTGRLNDFRRYDLELRTALGLPAGTRVLAGPHFYSTGWQNTFQDTNLQDAYDDGYRFGIQNMKTGDESTWAGIFTVGSHNAALTTFVNSVPADFVLVLMVNHEPENDGVQPNADGGTWENQYGPDWSRAEAHMATHVANLNRPNVFFAVCHMHITFPDSGQPGDLGFNNRNPENWNPWQHMSAAVKARTIFAPDIYTGWDDKATPTSWTGSTAVISNAEQSRIPNGSHVQVFTSNGTTLLHPGPFHVVSKTGSSGNPRTITVSPAWPSTPPAGSTLRKLDIFAHDYQAVLDYVQAAGWGVQQVGVSEHTLNNDYFVDEETTAWVWNTDIFPYLISLAAQGRLGYYAHFNRSDTAGASGQNGWVDLTDELLAVGNGARTLNSGAPVGGGGTGIVFEGSRSNDANNSTPTVIIPDEAAVGDFCLIPFAIGSLTVTLDETALTADGWDVIMQQDSGNTRGRLYGKILETGEPGSTWTGPVMSGTSRWQAQSDAWSGVDAADPIDQLAILPSSTANTVQTVPAITPTVDDCTVVEIVYNRGTVTANTLLWTPPANHSPRSSAYPDGLPGTSGAVADQANQPANIAHGPHNWQSDASLANFIGVTLSLRPA